MLLSLIRQLLSHVGTMMLILLLLLHDDRHLKQTEWHGGVVLFRTMHS